MTLTILEATDADMQMVAAVAAETFTETFGHLYAPEDLAAHLTSKCTPEHFIAAHRAGDTVLMLQYDGLVIGYCKVGRVKLPIATPIADGAQEIHRVYIRKLYQGRGFGKALMLHVLSLPRLTSAPLVYLGVWEENVKAQALYQLYNFKPVGRYLYYVGQQADREIIMARTRD